MSNSRGITKSTTIFLDESAAITSHIYKGNLELAYLADGSRDPIPETLKDCTHITLGGDNNYGRKGTTREKLLLNYENQFPSKGKHRFHYIEFGNHEHGTVGSKEGSTVEINPHLEHYSEEVQSNAVIENTRKFQTYPHIKSGKKFDIVPHAELFFPEDNTNKPVFGIIHIDSNILPLNKDYQKKLAELLANLATNHPECPLVISLHHAPDTYGVRRSDKKDAIKYIKHLRQLGIIDDSQEQDELKRLQEEYKKWKEKNDGSLSPYSWNRFVAEALENVFGSLSKKPNVIATESGHDHYAGLALQANGFVNFWQGNSSEQATPIFNSAKQQVSLEHYRKHRKGKIFGMDPYKSERDAKYLKLGFGKWTLNSSSEPTYTQYYYKKVISDPTDVEVATTTVFHRDGKVTIKDYLNYVECCYERGKEKQVVTIEEPKISEIINTDLSTEDPDNHFDYKEFMSELKHSFYTDTQAYQDKILSAYENNQLTMESIIKLNRLIHGASADPQNTDTNVKIDEIIKTYESHDGKGIFRKIFGNTKTIRDLKQLLLISGSNAITEEDVKLILMLRDRREPDFRVTKTSKTSLDIFNEAKNSNELSKSLSHTEEAISELGKVFRPS